MSVDENPIQDNLLKNSEEETGAVHLTHEEAMALLTLVLFSPEPPSGEGERAMMKLAAFCKNSEKLPSEISDVITSE